jgi:hypothetical protein
VPQPRSPLDAALDLFVYVPVGLAVTAAEELPKLAAKGRSRVDTQLKTARVVGEFAVASARQQLERRLAAPPAPAPSAPATGGAPVAPTSTPPAGAAAPVPPPAATARSARQSVSPNGSPPAPPGPAPSSSSLAIPGYDSLSASQVVQRLAGLSSDELAAVAAYERAHRARRTILTRAAQLQGTA